MKRNKKSTLKTKSKKDKTFRIRNVVTTLISILVLIAFILLMVIQPVRNKNVHDDEVAMNMKVPEFRNDGDLTFLGENENDTVVIEVEVVRSQEEIMRGLMYRPYLPESSGMFFIFPREEARSFWMKNTYISLDIIFVNERKEIVTIQTNTQPLSTQAVPSYKPAKYVVEVNAGFCERNGIKEGDRISFEF